MDTKLRTAVWDQMAETDRVARYYGHSSPPGPSTGSWREPRSRNPNAYWDSEARRLNRIAKKGRSAIQAEAGPGAFEAEPDRAQA